MKTKIIACVILSLFLLPGYILTAESSPQASPSIVENVTELMMRTYIQTLQDFGPRVTGSLPAREAAFYITSQFQEFGLNVSQLTWNYRNMEDINVVATLPGINQSSNEIYVICAHHDSVRDSPGADDNGSGTAAVLAAAQVLSRFQFEHTIRFITFSGEEQGLLGSHEYAREANESGENIVAVLNADMIAYTETLEGQQHVDIFEDTTSTWVTELVINVSQDYPESINLNISRPGPSSRSDHYYFLEYGYNAVFFSEHEFNSPNYHSPSDTIDKLDLDYATRITRLMVATLVELADLFQEDEEKPWLTIEKPKQGYLYLGNQELLALPNQHDIAVILGKIDLQATAQDNGSGIYAVEFYIDNELKYIDTEAPYSYLWDEPSLFYHTLGIKALDKSGNQEFKEYSLFTLNF